MRSGQPRGGGRRAGRGNGAAAAGVRGARRRVRSPAGTQRARAGAQTSLHVPYGDGDREKLDIYFPADPSGCR